MNQEMHKSWDNFITQENDADQIAGGKPGSSPDVPFTIAPADWLTEGLPYGAWCRCSRCAFIGRSTISFDFYTEGNAGAGHALICETCNMESRSAKGTP